MITLSDSDAERIAHLLEVNLEPMSKLFESGLADYQNAIAAMEANSEAALMILNRIRYKEAIRGRAKSLMVSKDSVDRLMGVLLDEAMPE